MAQFFEKYFTDPITITINVGFGEIGGQAMFPGALGESSAFYVHYTYLQVKNALVTDAKSGDDLTAIATLPSTDPTSTGNYWMTQAEAKALGLLSGNTGLDGFVGFSSAVGFDYDLSDGVTPGSFDFFGTVAHEITEVMGRTLLVGNGGYDPLDLFHYSAAGLRDFTGTKTGYFSINGGSTNLASFNTNSGGDFGDWATSVGHDAFAAFVNSGVVNAVSAADLVTMDAIGYDRASTATTPATPAPHDFNADGKSDVLWRSTNGAVSIWEMNGTQLLSSGIVDPWGADSTWQAGGVGDFNADGKADILWRHTTDGLIAIWEMNGTHIQNAEAVSLYQPDSTWQIDGIGDFNGDGTSDVLWRSNGTIAIWEMNQAQIQGGGIVNDYQPDSTWQVDGVGDFDGDGKSDILWRKTDGTVAIWEMNGSQIKTAGIVGPWQLDSTWQIEGVGDFDGDGKSDILWRNTNGTVAMWEMNGTQLKNVGIVSMQADSSWQMGGVGDFNGDGKSDILWRNTAGTAAIWEMNGTQVQTAAIVAQPDNSWQIIASS